MAAVDASTMAEIARNMLRMGSVVQKGDDKTFRSAFGAPMSIIAKIWGMILSKGNLRHGAHPRHLLWAFVLLKTYGTQPVCRCICGWPAEKDYREWSWYFVGRIADLQADVIKLDNRFDGYQAGTHCLISVDCIDCMINEPWPFDEKWYSQKFNGPGVKYEIAVCIKTGYIVWMNGPFEASHSDGTICINKLLPLLADDEGVEVDSGYKGHDKFKRPETANSRDGRKKKSVVRGRHENVNSRLKIFDVLNIPFRHLNPRNKMMEKHGKCFSAVVVVTQLKFENGESLYEVPYDLSYD
jgi:hypothetical protein